MQTQIDNHKKSLNAQAGRNRHSHLRGTIRAVPRHRGRHFAPPRTPPTSLSSPLSSISSPSRLVISDSSKSSAEEQVTVEETFREPSDPREEELLLEIRACQERFRSEDLAFNLEQFSITVIARELGQFFEGFKPGRALEKLHIDLLLQTLPWPRRYTVLETQFLGGTEESVDLPEPPESEGEISVVVLPCFWRDRWTLVEATMESRLSMDLRCHNAPDDAYCMEVANVLDPLFKLPAECMIAPDSAVGYENHSRLGPDKCGVFLTATAERLAGGSPTDLSATDVLEYRLRGLRRIKKAALLMQVESDLSQRLVLTPIANHKRRIEHVYGETDMQRNATLIAEVDWTPLPGVTSVGRWVQAAQVWSQMLQSRSRAISVLCLIEMIGSEAVRDQWLSTISHPNLETMDSNIDPEPVRISRLLERSSQTTFKGKAFCRLGQWYFARRILIEVGQLKSRGPPSRQSPSRRGSEHGQALTRALEKFLSESAPTLPPAEAGRRYERYRRWWTESKIWVDLGNAFGSWILLLIPHGLSDRMGRRVTDKR